MVNFGNISIADLRLGSVQVKAVYLGDKLAWSNAPAWLCFTAEQASSTVHLDKNGSPNAIYLETSTDGETWTDYEWSGNTGDTLTLANVGDKVYMRAKTENQTIGSSFSDYYKFVMTGKIAASGNIQTLLKADGSRTDAPTFCYSSMFSGCTSLTAAPSLPATTLANYCYYNMFYGCTSLATAPALPATTLASACYQQMFYGCSSLTTAPSLPATTIAVNCYYGMFWSCSSLTTAPALPATTLAGNCYDSMFQNCTSLSSVEVAFTEWTSGATTNWLQRVAASGTFKCPAELPDTRGASNIPTGWTKEAAHPEYIEADGRQCLVTNYKPEQGDSWELTWGVTVPYSELLSSAGENKGWCNYTYWSGGGRYTNGVVCPWILGNVDYSPAVQTSTVSVGEIFTEHIDTPVGSGQISCTMYRNATQQQSTGKINSPTQYYNQFNISLASENSGQSDSKYSYMKIYRWKHWRNSQLIEDLIPANYNGVGAMYDLVSQQYITSNTGTDFLLPQTA